MISDHSGLFKGHLLPASDNFLEKVVINTSWETIVVCVVLALLTSIFVLYRRKAVLMIQSLFSQRFFSQLIREGKLLTERIYILLLAVVFLVQSLALVLIIDYFFPSLFSSYSFLLKFAFAFIIFFVDYLLKMLSLYIFTLLFEYKDELYSWTLYKLFYLTLTSLFLYPIVVLVLYTKQYYFFGLYIPVLLLSFLLMAYKMFTINPKKINLFQFFIYFCTVEILPYLVGIKILLNLGK
ncbi:MAG: DUF4271 domain-containing protein [Bacteroidales bacterium]